MNPDYMKRQENPDGKQGHVEREKIYKDIKQKPGYDAGTSLRLASTFYNEGQTSLSDLQREIRMRQCVAKTGECYNKDYEDCMNCAEYKIS